MNYDSGDDTRSPERSTPMPDQSPRIAQTANDAFTPKSSAATSAVAEDETSEATLTTPDEGPEKDTGQLLTSANNPQALDDKPLAAGETARPKKLSGDESEYNSSPPFSPYSPPQ